MGWKSSGACADKLGLAELVSSVQDAHLSVPDWDVNDDFLAARSDGRAIDRDAVHPLLVAGVPHCRGFGQPGRKQEVLLLKVLILANRNQATVESSRHITGSYLNGMMGLILDR